MTAMAVLNLILPYTEEERKCGEKKIPKQQARYELLQKITAYRDGKEAELPEEVLKLLNQ